MTTTSGSRSDPVVGNVAVATDTPEKHQDRDRARWLDDEQLRRELLADHVVILDGGQATELEKDPRIDLEATCLWSAGLLLDAHAELQETVVRMHRDYFLAGADVSTTVSYQASLEGFAREQAATTHEDMARYYDRSIALAVRGRDAAWAEIQARGEKRMRPLVAASIGCYGAILADGSEYRGEYGLTRDELVAWHRPRFAYFAAHAGVDLLMLETVPCNVEVEALILLINEHPRVRVLLSVACRDGSSLNSGEPIARLTSLLDGLADPRQLIAVGVNCTAPQHVESLLRAFSCACAKLAYPNSGEGWDGVEKKWLPVSEPFGACSWNDYLPKWFDAGARFFGGCCRTGPMDIRAMRAHFDHGQLLQ